MPCSCVCLALPACSLVHPPASADRDGGSGVCTKLRNDSEPLLSCAVQQLTPDAVGGQFVCTSSSSSVCIDRHLIIVVSNSGCALPASARLAPASASPSSASNLASATARPPGAFPAPLPANAALPVSALFVNSDPSNRRLLFEPGPKLATRLKLG